MNANGGLRIWVAGGCLHARAIPRIHWQSLSILPSRVAVNPAAEEVLIGLHLLLLCRRERRVPFTAIRRIDYSHVYAAGRRRRRSRDTYTVSLVLLGAEEEVIPLFRFSGRDSVGWDCEWNLPSSDGRIDMSGDPKTASRRSVMVLQQFTGKPLV